MSPSLRGLLGLLPLKPLRGVTGGSQGRLRAGRGAGTGSTSSVAAAPPPRVPRLLLSRGGRPPFWEQREAAAGGWGLSLPLIWSELKRGESDRDPGRSARRGGSWAGTIPFSTGKFPTCWARGRAAGARHGVARAQCWCCAGRRMLQAHGEHRVRHSPQQPCGPRDAAVDGGARGQRGFVVNMESGVAQPEVGAGALTRGHRPACRPGRGVPGFARGAGGAQHRVQSRGNGLWALRPCRGDLFAPRGTKPSWLPLWIVEQKLPGGAACLVLSSSAAPRVGGAGVRPCGQGARHAWPPGALMASPFLPCRGHGVALSAPDPSRRSSSRSGSSSCSVSSRPLRLCFFIYTLFIFFPCKGGGGSNRQG